MKRSVTIDAAGRLVLPKAIRERLNLRAGARLRVDLEAGGILLRPEADGDKVEVVQEGKRKVLRVAGPPVDVVEAIKQDREARLGRLAEGPERENDE